MSGGSFDYLYFQLEEHPFDWATLDTLNAMSIWLSEQAVAETEAADELKELHGYLRNVFDEASARIAPLLTVIKAAEWWCSGDTAQDYFRETWQRYIAGRPNTRLESDAAFATAIESPGNNRGAAQPR